MILKKRQKEVGEMNELEEVCKRAYEDIGCAIDALSELT